MGKSLKDSFASLSSLGLKNGCRVMLIGKKYVPEEDENVKAMQVIDSSVEKLHTKLTEIQGELQGIEKGYLSNELQLPALKKLEKRISTCSEEYLRLLETLDALLLGDCASDVKGKRKSLVSLIQKHLDEADRLQNSVKESVAKLQS